MKWKYNVDDIVLKRYANPNLGKIIFIVKGYDYSSNFTNHKSFYKVKVLDTSGTFVMLNSNHILTKEYVEDSSKKLTKQEYALEML